MEQDFGLERTIKIDGLQRPGLRRRASRCDPSTSPRPVRCGTGTRPAHASARSATSP